jgi:hypothetical protein
MSTVQAASEHPCVPPDSTSKSGTYLQVLLTCITARVSREVVQTCEARTDTCAADPASKPSAKASEPGAREGTEARAETSSNTTAVRCHCSADTSGESGKHGAADTEYAPVLFGEPTIVREFLSVSEHQ